MLDVVTARLCLTRKSAGPKEPILHRYDRQVRPIGRYALTNVWTVMAYFHAKPEKKDELERILLDFVVQTRQEEGCVQYHLHRSNDDANLFVFYENFTSRAAWEEHNKRPFLTAFIAKQHEYLEREIEVVTCTMLSLFAVSASSV